ncbi:3'-5' exonuclease [Serratia symbiotica]|uniref:3'-5' exoribonuclease n=1 Tax=Serratia symbiotica TaxID=138074 RepID=A0A068Z791_9GAMM|nr:3'-5' exonuclease [Serratia symbiotica]QLH62764.1 3'-5' exoribonuclease [Serratia symbiotica]CDS58079.1 Exodeoxyribonuclease VIII [Serratia symbiotica]
MNHLMIDLETLGTDSTAPIASIGAVFFEPSTGCTGGRFYVRVDFASDMALGAKPDGYAMKWWLKQSSEARAELVNDEALPVGRALSQLCQFIKDNQQPAGKKHLRVWGNGASFDCVILRAAYARVGITPPWDWWRDLDVRTVVEMGRGLGYDQKYNLIFKGVQHTALDDALHQVAYVSEIWQRLTADKEPIL